MEIYMQSFLRKFVVFFVTISLTAPTLVFAEDELSSSLDEIEEDDAYAMEIWDPLEPVNRGIFWFNDQAYVYVMKPVADGYDYITPKPVQNCISNFFKNLNLPIDFVSNILQAELTQAGKTFGRFVVNTTVGVVGFFDIAQSIGLERSTQDTGLAFARWGIPHGFYLVIPFMGPSSLRDGIGTVADGFIHPIEYPIYLNSFSNTDEWWYLGAAHSARTIDLINRRKDAIETAKEGSLDYYLFLQAAYYQLRYQELHRKSSTGSSNTAVVE